MAAKPTIVICRSDDKFYPQLERIYRKQLFGTGKATRPAGSPPTFDEQGVKTLGSRTGSKDASDQQRRVKFASTFEELESLCETYRGSEIFVIIGPRFAGEDSQPLIEKLQAKVEANKLGKIWFIANATNIAEARKMVENGCHVEAEHGRLNTLIRTLPLLLNFR